jgi:glycosyltransferase involved in cell wall biosynthesis
MRVLWIIDGLGRGGAENMMPPLLKQLNERGIESRVCVLQVKKDSSITNEIERLGIQVDVVNVTRLRNPTNLVTILRYVRQYRPDIIHTQLEESDIFGTIAAKIMNIPSITTLHTLEVVPKTDRSYWRNLIRWNLLGLFCSQIIAVSEITRQHYISMGIKRNKIITLYNGVDLNRFMGFRENPPQKKSIFGLPNDSIVLSTVAVLREAKGLQFMLEAIPEILNKIPDLYYVIAGDGEYREALQQKLKYLRLDDRVKFLGYRSDIPQILAASDLFVFPSLIDALPTVLLEAMAVGKPIVSSNVGGIPEILENGVNGLLVPPASSTYLVGACIQVLTDSGFASRLAANAIQVVQQRFDIRKQAGSLVDLYDRMVLGNAN